MDELFSAEQIAARIAEMGREIREFYRGRDLTLIAVMNGGAFFAADLARAVDLPLWFDSIRAASYSDDRRGEFHLESEPKLDPRGRQILLADDVFDSGNTLRLCRELLLDRGAAEVRCAVLVNKIIPGRSSMPDWAGFSAPDRYLVGVGMDSHEMYRNCPFVGAI